MSSRRSGTAMVDSGIGAVPVVPQSFVTRSRLTDSLDATARTALTVVSASAGSGKTLMLADWVARREFSFTWLAAEPEDGDPLHFWSRLLLALQSASRVSLGNKMSLLRPPDVFERRFVSAIADAGRSLTADHLVIIDDAHLLQGTPTMATLADLLRRRGGPLRLLLSTRVTLALPMERLRLEGTLAELTTEDLAFRSTEAADLLARNNVVLSADQLDTVERKTEGWAVGLRLAAEALHHTSDLAGSVADLAGDQRGVADYFVQEVLAQQPPAVRQFLVDTSVVDRVSADLANALTGRSDGFAMLARLERDNLFVVALDNHRTWFRYQHLFADLLRQSSELEDPARTRALHLRAAQWYLGHGQPMNAASQFAVAQEWRALSTLIVRVLGPSVLGSQRRSVLELVGRLPVAVVTDTPDGAVAAAIADLARIDAAGMGAHLDRARCTLPLADFRETEITDAVITAGEAIAGYLDGDSTAQLRLARRALATFDRITIQELPALPAYRASAAAIVAVGLLWTGELERADHHFARLLPVIADAGELAAVLSAHLYGNRAVLHAVQGRLALAEKDSDAALALAHSPCAAHPCAAAYLAQALVHLQRVETPAGEQAVKRGQACLADENNPQLEVALTLVSVGLELMQGRPSAARSVLTLLRREIPGRDLPAVLVQSCALVAAEVELARYPHADRRRSSPEPGLADSVPASASRTILQARIALAEVRPRDCLRLLDELRVPGEVNLIHSTEAWLLSALAFYQLRQESDARRALRHALEASVENGIARPFVQAGRASAGLLRHYLAVETPHSAWANRLLGLLEEHDPRGPLAGLVEPLTNRERGVLALLPSMMNNAEIAEELFLSVNTIKVHLKSLYRKLGVSNRRQAVRVGREHGLRELDSSFEDDIEESASGA